MTEYYLTVGLEIHAELATKSKMFCGCKNDPDETRPNINICPVCMAHPGTLPVPNKQAIASVINVGLALGANIANFSEFDRKNYFYPDIPKGYQISQYKYPIVSGGALDLPAQTGGVAITRIHLEEDTGLSKHLPAQAGDPEGYTLVDYNRAGVPLMELVTEPVITSAKQAGDFARELQLLLRTLGVSEANLEKGEMRVEPNISISPTKDSFGTKVEVKNLNSFRSVEKAIEYEYARMVALYEAGRASEIVQETRGWNESTQTTFSQRSKENANDYRYFPDPDLPKMQLHDMFDLDAMRNALPELPWQKRVRYQKDFGLSSESAEMLVVDKVLADYFEAVVLKLEKPTLAVLVANYLLTDLVALSKKDTNFTYPDIALFAELIGLVAEEKITSRVAKDLLVLIVTEGISPTLYATEHGLLQQNNTEALQPIIELVITENPKMVADYRGGKEAAIQGLVGMVMKASKGSANPGIALDMLKNLLK